MRWILVAALAFTACCNAPTDEETASVYRAFLTHWSEGAEANVAEHTIPLEVTAAELRQCMPLALFTDVQRARSTTHNLREDLQSTALIRLVDPETQRLEIEANDASRTIVDGLPIDDALDSAFASGLVQLSEITFDVTGRRAVLGYQFSCGMLCRAAGTVVLDRNAQGDWIVSDRDCGPTTLY
jgi:hypothetical protein